MTNEEIMAEVLTLPVAAQRTPEEQRLHEERKVQQRLELEQHLAELMVKKGIKPATTT